MRPEHILHERNGALEEGMAKAWAMGYNAGDLDCKVGEMKGWTKARNPYCFNAGTCLCGDCK